MYKPLNSSVLSIIEEAFDLSPAEHDLMTLVVNELFSQSVGGKQVFISAKEFAIANKISEKYAYAVLNETADRLQSRKIKTKVYKDALKVLVGGEDPYSIARPKGTYKLLDLHANWVQAVGYQKKSGFIYFMFSHVVVYLIQKTGETYTKYPYEKTIDLKRFHTKRLYKFCCKRADLKPPQGKKYPQAKMVVGKWRDFFGCADKHDKIAEFKRRVLEPVIKEINEQGEFELTLEQEKAGKIITYFTLVINDKRKKADPLAEALSPSKDRDSHTPDILHGLTDKEVEVVHQKVADYIAHLESKGEEINEFRRKNIKNKAIDECWGLDEYYAELQEAENVRRERLESEKEQRRGQVAQDAKNPVRTL